MIGVYDNSIKTALRLVAKYGEPCVWSKPAPQVDGAKPWRDSRDPDVEPETYNVSLAFFSPQDLSRGSGEFAMYDAGTEVVGYSQVGIMGAYPFTPEMTDTLETSSGKMQIVYIDPIAPAGIPVMYYVAVK